MIRVDLILAFALGAEVPIILAAVYFLKRRLSATAVVTVAPPPVATAAAAVAPIKAKAPASRFVTCIKCGRTVARYTPTPEGPICANELPIV